MPWICEFLNMAKVILQVWLSSVLQDGEIILDYMGRTDVITGSLYEEGRSEWVVNVMTETGSYKHGRRAGYKLRNAGSLQKLEKANKQSLLWSLQKKWSPAHTWFYTSELQAWKNKFVLF